MAAFPMANQRDEILKSEHKFACRMPPTCRALRELRLDLEKASLVSFPSRLSKTEEIEKLANVSAAV